MDLCEFHHFEDGRLIAFDRHTVLLIEEHSSGSGTYVRLGPVERTIDVHLREAYADVQAELSLSVMDRTMRRSVQGYEISPF